MWDFCLSYNTISLVLCMLRKSQALNCSNKNFAYSEYRNRFPKTHSHFLKMFIAIILFSHRQPGICDARSIGFFPLHFNSFGSYFNPIIIATHGSRANELISVLILCHFLSLSLLFAFVLHVWYKDISVSLQNSDRRSKFIHEISTILLIDPELSIMPSSVIIFVFRWDPYLIEWLLYNKVLSLS